MKGLDGKSAYEYALEGGYTGTEQDFYNKLVKEIPTKVSELQNDSNFITKAVNDLESYYLKSETYTQEEINEMVSLIPKFKIEVVKELPITDINYTTIYIVKNDPDNEDDNLFTEYIRIDMNDDIDAKDDYWEKLGEQKLDLSSFPGKKVTGQIFTINGAQITAADGAEIFNDYENNIATGKYSHAEGKNTLASGIYSHAEGSNTEATNSGAHAEGYGTIASGNLSHAEGYFTTSSGQYGHTEGWNTQISSNALAGHAEGYWTKVLANYGHAEGNSTEVSYDSAHAEGSASKAKGEASHAEGSHTEAIGHYSHAEGGYAIASGNYSHAEGYQTKVNHEAAHVEGYYSKAEGACSHAEGSYTEADGDSSHAEGYYSKTSNSYTHAEGYFAEARGWNSHAEGAGTIASGESQHAQGKYNIEDAENKYAHIVGNGAYQAPSNAHTLDWEGNAWFAGNIRIGGTSYETGKEPGAKPNMTKVTLTASDWDTTTLTQVATIKGIKADETAQAIYINPVFDDTIIEEIGNCNVYASTQGENSITFSCDTAPTIDVEFYVKWQDVAWIEDPTSTTINPSIMPVEGVEF